MHDSVIATRSRRRSSSTSNMKWSSGTTYQSGQIVWDHGSYWRYDGPYGAKSTSPNNSFHLWTPINSTSSFPPSEPSLQSTILQKGKQVAVLAPQPHHLNQSSNTTPTSPSASLTTPSQSSTSSGLVDTRDGDSNSPHESDSSPDSQATITASSPNPNSHSHSLKSHNNPSPPTPSSSSSSSSSSSQRQRTKATQSERNNYHSYFAQKAEESLRYITVKQENHRGRNEDEFKDELEGKRIWRIGGVGLWAFGPDIEIEKKKEKFWEEKGEGEGKGREGWLEIAQKRTKAYEGGMIGAKPLITWRLTNRTSPFPPTAIPIGHELDGRPLYAARAYFNGGLHLGKAGPHLYGGACISYAGAEISFDEFEVLCAPQDPTLLKWMEFRHGERLRIEGFQPVEGGREKSGEGLYVAKGEWEGGEHPGKCRAGDDHAHIAWGGGEVWVRPFYVLAYASSSRR